MSTKLVNTFLELAAIDEVYPNENKVLTYVKQKLRASSTPFKQDKTGNIVATLGDSEARPIAFCSHMDIAAPLHGRKVIQKSDRISTDKTGLLGGDDKTGVAALLELAHDVSRGTVKLARKVQLIFTVGEQAGLVGANNLDFDLVAARDVLVFDWLGSVNRIIERSPAYYKIDVTFVGQDAHPAEWQKGKNAGLALMKAAAGLHQGDYSSDTIFNIGIVTIGDARNKVPGAASLKAEVRSFNGSHAKKAAEEVAEHFRTAATEHSVAPQITVDASSQAYQIDKDSELFKVVTGRLKVLGYKPVLEETYGCFDGNVLAHHGVNALNMGAAFYNPHGPEEYVNLKEFEELYGFIKHMASTTE